MKAIVLRSNGYLREFKDLSFTVNIGISSGTTRHTRGNYFFRCAAVTSGSSSFFHLQGFPLRSPDPSHVRPLTIAFLAQSVAIHLRGSFGNPKITSIKDGFEFDVINQVLVPCDKVGDRLYHLFRSHFQEVVSLSKSRFLSLA